MFRPAWRKDKNASCSEECKCNDLQDYGYLQSSKSATEPGQEEFVLASFVQVLVAGQQSLCFVSAVDEHEWQAREPKAQHAWLLVHQSDRHRLLEPFCSRKLD